MPEGVDGVFDRTQSFVPRAESRQAVAEAPTQPADGELRARGTAVHEDLTANRQVELAQRDGEAIVVVGQQIQKAL